MNFFDVLFRIPNKAGDAYIEPATADLQNAQLAKTDPTAGYTILDEDSAGVLKYYGKAISDTKYIIMLRDTSTQPIIYRYANVSNNATKTSYKAANATGAWLNRATLNYGYHFDLTGI